MVYIAIVVKVPREILVVLFTWVLRNLSIFLSYNNGLVRFFWNHWWKLTHLKAFARRRNLCCKNLTFEYLDWPAQIIFLSFVLEGKRNCCIEISAGLALIGSKICLFNRIEFDNFFALPSKSQRNKMIFAGHSSFLNSIEYNQKHTHN